MTADWHPFEAKDCETGLITINFRNISTGKEFQYVNKEKFSSYHTDLITFADGFKGYKNGETYTIQYVTKPNPFEESPIDYYLPFQFYDVDFDGEKELLINDYYKGQQGNNYDIFEIADSGLEAKKYRPFGDIDNMVVFDGENKNITLNTYDGAHSSCSVYFQKIATSTLQEIVIPENLDGMLKRDLAYFAPVAPSYFHIIATDIKINGEVYKLKVDNGKWVLVD